MRASSRFDANDAISWECRVPDQELGVLGGVDVVGYHRQTDPVAQCNAETPDKGGLARAHRTSDTDAHRVFSCAHEANTLLRKAGCRNPTMSIIGRYAPISSIGMVRPRAAAVATWSCRPVTMRCAAPWPITPRRTAAAARPPTNPAPSARHVSASFNF